MCFMKIQVNFQDKEKLSYRYYFHKVSLSIENILLHIFFSCNLLILGYSPGIEWSRISVASRCILVPFERYGRPKNAPKKVLVTLFPCKI